MRYWKRIDTQGKTTTVESYDHNLDIEGAIEISEQEFNDYIASLPVIETPTFRDLEADIDKLIARVEKLEKKVK